MIVDGWHIPDAWAEGSNEGSVKYVGSIRVWPVGDSGFAVVAHHVEECSMNAYYGPVGVLRSREAPQEAWDLEHLGMYAEQVVSLPFEGGHLAFINAAFRAHRSQRENPILVVHVPTMRLSAIRFVRGWAFDVKRIVEGRVVFEHRPSTGPPALDQRTVVAIPVARLPWTDYAKRPRTGDEATRWFFRHARPRDVDLLAQVQSWVRSKVPLP